MKIVRFLYGFLVGVGTGFSLGMLLTPRRGEENIRLARETYDAILAEGKLAAAERRAELQAELDVMRRA